MPTLVWPIKASLVKYVRGAGDGSATASGGVAEVDETFHFPGTSDDDGIFRFVGSVHFTAHHGMLHVAVADPWLEPSATGWQLSILGSAGDARRIRLATISAVERDTDGSLRGSEVLLASPGADLFTFGPYGAGTPFDDLTVMFSLEIEPVHAPSL